MESRFETEYTSLLPAILASHSRLQDSGKEQTTLDTFGRILRESLRQLDLFGSSAKTSADTLPLDSPKFTEAYEIWVTLLRQDYLARQSAARPTSDADCLSWQTMRVNDAIGSAYQYSSGDHDKPFLMLTGQVKVSWPTPKTPTGGGQGQRQTPGGGIRKLEDALIINGLLAQASPSTNGKSRGLWATPQERDYRSGHEDRWDDKENRSRNLNDQAAQSKTGKLNPDWVEQLQGLPVGWTDCDYSATG
jgi:hypothetical protein